MYDTLSGWSPLDSVSTATERKPFFEYGIVYMCVPLHLCLPKNVYVYVLREYLNSVAVFPCHNSDYQ